jgi:hypothetical protein
LIGAGTIINPIIKVVTTVAILGAVYLLFVRPILDTTEEVASKTQAQIAQAQTNAAESSAAAALNSAESRAESYESSLRNTWAAAAREVSACVRDARGKLEAMERCAEFGQTAAHTLQSDYLFATSHADTLESQGDTADAERIRDCVDRAGFKVGPMEHCRTLADDLLFG